MQKQYIASASSYGKLIVTGEHGVVYGHPALALPLPIEIRVTLNMRKNHVDEEMFVDTPYIKHIKHICEEYFGKTFPNIRTNISSSLPQNAGFGSSAALAHAYVLAYMKLCNVVLSKKKLFEVVLECEKYMHTHPSGVDPAVVVFHTPLVFQKKENGFVFQYKPLSFFPLHKCVVIHSGSAVESTKDMIELVSKNPKKDDLFTHMHRCTQDIIHSLENKQMHWELITKNERILEELGVVGESARNIIHQIEEVGGNAKMCGAGGVQKGSGAILAYHPNLKVLKYVIRKNNWEKIL